MMRYIYDHPDWPALRWDRAALAEPLAGFRFRQGRFIARMEALGVALKDEASLRTLTDDAVKTSEIEGEVLDPRQVRSSLARRLGLDAGGLVPSDRGVDGIVDMLLDAAGRFAEPLTADRLFAWHAMLFPTGRSGLRRITIGAWRAPEGGEMIVASGPPGRETVHFRAPAAERVPCEMDRFLAWFESTTTAVDPVLKAAIAHIWFVTIHPFDDGNGRIGRAIADLCLARSEGIGRRFYSVSARLRVERNAYYETLEAAQKGDLDITLRLLWFIRVLDRALDDAKIRVESVLRKARFWARPATLGLGDRPRKILAKLLDGFEGKLTSSKYARLAGCSQDTALRDIDALLALGLLRREPGGGRSTGYALCED